MKVLKPWTNMTVQEFENGYAVNVWGRTYTFANSLFPTSIVTQGVELLDSPIQLKMDFGYGEQTPYAFEYQIMEKANDKVVVTSSALCGNIIVNVATTLEFDGFIKFAVRLVPVGQFEYVKGWQDDWAQTTDILLKSARLSIPLKSPKSSLLHYWPSGEDSSVQKPIVTSGYFGDLSLPFKASVWAGNENVGLNFCMESDENIQLDDKNTCIRTTIGEDANEISIQLLDKAPRQWTSHKENWGDALDPVSYVMMLEATPIKPLTRSVQDDWRVIVSDVSGKDLDTAAKYGAKWAHFHEDWSMIQNFGYPKDKENTKEIVKKAHSLGLKVMPYFGYEYSTAMVDWEEKKDEYLIVNKHGHHTGLWTRGKTYQRAYMTCYHSGYSERVLEAARYAMDEMGFDGIYTDGMYMPIECANEKHGCGYRDADGVLHPTFPILACREHVKKLYALVHERGGRVDAHQSSCCVLPIMAFCDSYFDGENLQYAMADNMMATMRLEAFRCEFYGKNFGITPQMVTYLKPPHYVMRNVLSLCLLHDMLPRLWLNSTPEELQEVSAVWQAYDSFGVSSAKWIPYWEKATSVTSDHKGVYISAFEKEDGILAFISVFDDTSDAHELELSLPATFHQAKEWFDGQCYSVVDGKMKVVLKPAIGYMFEIH